MEKPLFYLGSAWLWALMLIAFTGTPMAGVLGVLALGAAIWLLWLLRRTFQDREKLRFFLAAALMVLAACVFYLVQWNAVYRPALSHAGEKATGTYLVTEVLNDSPGGAHRCVVKVLEGGPVRRLRFSSSKYVPKVGDVFSAALQLSELGAGEPDIQRYYRSRGLYLGATTSGHVYADPLRERAARGEVDLSPPRLFVWRVYTGLAGFRDHRMEHLSDRLPEDLGAILRGMLVGDKTEIPSETNEMFRKAGILHLFAVSGFHTALWTMLFYKLLLRAGAGKRTAAFGAILFLLVFVMLTGLSRSAVRAGVMLGMFFLGRMVARTSEPLNTLGAAALCVVAPNPFYGGDAGVLLSYFATLGILSLYPPLLAALRKRLKERVHNYKLRKRLESPAALVLLTLSTFMATLPVVTLSFGNVSLAAFLSNLLVTFAAEAAILLAGSGALCSAVPGLSLMSPWCYLGAGMLARYLLAASGRLAALPLSYVSLTGRGFGLGLAAALLTATAGFVLYSTLQDPGMVRVTALLSAIVLLGSVLTEAALNREVIKVTFPDVSGTCAVVSYRHGAAVIGCGSDDYQTTTALNDLFQREGITRFSALVVPREQQTETGAMKAVLEEREPGFLLDPETVEEQHIETVWLAPQIALHLFHQNGDCCAGLLEADGVRFLLLFRPTVDLSALPPEARAAPVCFVRGNPPEGLKSGPSSYIIVSGETGELEARVRHGKLRLYQYR
ncbi:MAG: ComEC/Rec2 family competence protein [Clostridia bacterium]|nr:ComEC/Rec2 family competence protein [Clostridia bacterium]